MVAQPTNQPDRASSRRSFNLSHITRQWNKLPENAQVAVLVAVILLMGAVVIGFLRLSVADRPASQQLPAEMQRPVASVPTAVPTAQPQATPAPEVVGVELVMLHDVTNPASSFTIVAELDYVNSAVVGFNSQVPACYLIFFDSDATQAWTCDPRVSPITPPTVDYAPKPTAIPAPPPPPAPPAQPVYNSPSYSAPPQQQVVEQAPVLSDLTPLDPPVVPAAVDNGTGSQPKPVDNGTGSTSRPSRSRP